MQTRPDARGQKLEVMAEHAQEMSTAPQFMIKTCAIVRFATGNQQDTAFKKDIKIKNENN